MLALFSRDNLMRSYRDPIAWLILAVDLFPLWAIFILGWRAEPLIFLYWLENLIIGLVTLIRMVIASFGAGRGGAAAIGFLAPFFLVHYGLFCFVHGIFLHVFTAIARDGVPDFLSPIGLIARALESGPMMPLFVMSIIVLQAILIWRDFVLAGVYKNADLRAEMSAPYGRIIILHFALFAGVAAMIFIGEPLIGILGLLFIRVVWGVYLTAKRRLWLDGAEHKKS